MPLQINSAGLVPNPVDASSQYIISIEVEEITLPYIGLFDDTNDAIFDSGNNRIYVENIEPTDTSYVSAYSSIQMNSFISSVLGV